MAKRQKTGGRCAGTPNKTTRVLREAILTAAEQEGSDGNGADGLTGYLRSIAQSDVKAFAMLLGKVLPMQVGVDPDSPGMPLVSFTTVYEDGRPVERPVLEIQRRIVSPPAPTGAGTPASVVDSPAVLKAENERLRALLSAQSSRN